MTMEGSDAPASSGPKSFQLVTLVEYENGYGSAE